MKMVKSVSANPAVALNNEISYSYDELNNVTAIQDPLGRKVTYQYDNLNRLLSIVSAMGRERTFEYDSVGNVVAQVDPKGQQTEFEYTPTGKIKKISYSDGRQVSFDYDSLGNRTRMKDWTGDTTYKYDTFNRMVEVTTPDNRSVSYTYNDFDELINVGLKAQGIRGSGLGSDHGRHGADLIEWTYNYDKYGRLKSLSDPDGNETTYSYDIAGRLAESVLPNAVRKVMEYDQASNLLSMAYIKGRDELERFDYTYDAVGNRVAMSEDDGVSHYSYDSKYQLVKATKYSRPRGWQLLEKLRSRLGSNGRGCGSEKLQQNIEAILGRLNRNYEISYSYDSVGNRLSKDIDVKSNADGLESGFYQYSYDDDNRLVQEVLAKGTGNGPGKGHGGGHGNGGGHGWGNGGQITDFLYDLNGNLLEERKDNSVSRFGYDVMDNLVYASVPGKIPVAYTFNGDGMRTAQYAGRAYGKGHGNGKGKGCGDGCGQANSFFESFRWDMERSFAYSGPEVIAEFDGRDKLDQAFTYGPGIDNLISTTRANGNPGNRTSYYLTDALGSVRQVLSQRGKTMNSYSYTPFGEAFNVREAVSQPFRYTGRRWDENVGKYWYRSRHYDAGRGRFAQADKRPSSIISPITDHRYQYVTSNPLIWVDPYGWEKVIFQMGDIEPINVETLINGTGVDITRVVRITEEKQIMNYLYTGDRSDSKRDLDYRKNDPVESILFLGHGLQDVMTGKYFDGITNYRPILDKDFWTEFGGQTSKDLFAEKLTVEFRACYVGRSNDFMMNIAENLPNNSLVIGYSGKVQTARSLFSTYWGVYDEKKGTMPIQDTWNYTRLVKKNNCGVVETIKMPTIFPGYDKNF
jgi:RHS repeat-associated protein